MAKYKKCEECDSKQYEKDILIKFTDSIINRKVEVCSNSCFEAIKIREQDIINDYVKNNIDKLNVNLSNYEIERLKELINELKEKIDDEFYKGYTEGINEIIKINGICPRCKKHIIETIHHIIPREYGGYDSPEILIALCFKCHDEVELLTDELFKKGKIFDVFILRKFIIEKAFPNEH